MSPTKIEWVQDENGLRGESWNFLGGCTPFSGGCLNCYAAREAATRLAKHPLYEGLAELDEQGRGVWTGEVRVDERKLDRPSRWKRPRTIFVCSMSDLFQDAVPDDVIARAMEEIDRNPRHTYILLTKRPARMRLALDLYPTYPDTIWAGVSIEDGRVLERLTYLYMTIAGKRFVSVEPMIGPVRLANALDWLDWVIIGGESGPNARPMHLEWAMDLVEECQSAGVPVFVKQMGTHWAREHNYSDRKGAILSEMPEALRVRQMPFKKVLQPSSEMLL